MDTDAPSMFKLLGFCCKPLCTNVLARRVTTCGAAITALLLDNNSL